MPRPARAPARSTNDSTRSTLIASTPASVEVLDRLVDCRASHLRCQIGDASLEIGDGKRGPLLRHGVRARVHHRDRTVRGREVPGHRDIAAHHEHLRRATPGGDPHPAGWRVGVDRHQARLEVAASRGSGEAENNHETRRGGPDAHAWAWAGTSSGGSSTSRHPRRPRSVDAVPSAHGNEREPGAQDVGHRRHRRLHDRTGSSAHRLSGESVPVGTAARDRPRGWRGARAGEHHHRAMQRSMEVGADVLDVDLWMSSDGVVVARHDRELSTTTDGDGYIDAHTWNELSRLDAAATWTGEPIDGPVTIPRLDEILASFPDVMISLEIKQTKPSMAAALCDVLVAADAVDRVYLSSNDDAAVYEARDACPGTVLITTTYADLDQRRAAQERGEPWCAVSPIGQPPVPRRPIRRRRRRRRACPRTGDLHLDRRRPRRPPRPSPKRASMASTPAAPTSPDPSSTSSPRPAVDASD